MQRKIPPRSCPTGDLRDSPIYWFARMESARTRFDFETALAALNELERLGIRIVYARQRPGRTAEEGHHAT